MTLEAFAIQSEAWAQEEIGAQRILLAILERIERAAGSGDREALGRGAAELEGALAQAPARDARRRALLGRLSAALGLAAGTVTLSQLLARLAQAGLEERRLAALRAELRAVVASVVRASRRLAALARYHRGLLQELGGVWLAREGGGALVDAQG